MNFSSSSTWRSSSSSIATANTPGTVKGITPGTFTAYATTGYEPEFDPYVCPTGDGGVNCPTEQFTGSGQGRVVPPPTITNVTPDWGNVGTAPTVTVSGKGFGVSGTINALTGITITYGVPRNDTTIAAVFTIASGAPLGTQQIVVTTSNSLGDGPNKQSNPWNFQVTPASAVPANFQQTNAEDEQDGYIRVTYTWGSSTGNLADLSACQVREYVTYPTSGNSGCPAPNTGQMCYWPPSPPWPPTSQPGTGYVNPTPVPGPATAGGVFDSNTVQNYNFVKPYSNNSFPATQIEQYSCNSGTWVQFGGPFTITRQVTQNPQGQWVYSISKTGVSFSSTYVLP